MRSYGQLCAAALALDVVGDRWSLLIVRELLFDGPRRWTDLRAGLPGVAKNLLAERLRDLEAAGVVERAADERYALTARGRALEPVLDALVRWGAPLITGAPADVHARVEFVRTACRVHPDAELLEADDEHVRVRAAGELIEGSPAEVLRALARQAPVS
jgi:DNA-binding HxlR family transcriptional regulator